MRHTLPIAPQFYVTAPQVCPYLPDRIERKLFTSIQGDDAQILNDALSQQGFRRSQNILYRPSCNECSACLSARIDVKNFLHPKAKRKYSDAINFLADDQIVLGPQKNNTTCFKSICVNDMQMAEWLTWMSLNLQQ